MTKQTDVLLSITTFVPGVGGEPDRKWPSQHPHYRVKLDSRDFPYVVLDNEKVILTARTFPVVCHGRYGMERYEIDLIEGADEWAEIIGNPNLTVDRLSPIEIGHMALPG